MPPLVLPALLLRSHPYSESSRILRFLTPGNGVVAAIARGVRTRGSKSGSSLEIFTRGMLTLDHRPGRDLQGFRSFDAEDPHRGLQRSLVRFGAASFLGELAMRHGPEEGTATLFQGVDETLSLLEERDDPGAVALVVTAGWRIVALLGYTPELDHCVICGEPLAAEAMARFDHGAGGVRGEECVPPGGPPPGPLVGPGTRTVLTRMLMGDEPEMLPRPGAHLRLLHDFATWHMGGGRGLESYAFLASRVASFDPDRGEGDGEG
jgi:DNA repair protein RecO (recombination protein O)